MRDSKSLLDPLSSLLYLLAGFGLALGMLEWVANLIGISLIRNLHTPGRVLEMAAILLVFVIATTTRQILDVIRSGKEFPRSS